MTVSDYESVDEKSLSYAMSRKTTIKRIHGPNQRKLLLQFGRTAWRDKLWRKCCKQTKVLTKGK